MEWETRAERLMTREKGEEECSRVAVTRKGRNRSQPTQAVNASSQFQLQPIFKGATRFLPRRVRCQVPFPSEIKHACDVLYLEG